MLRWTKPGLAGERVGKAVVFTTRIGGRRGREGPGYFVRDGFGVLRRSWMPGRCGYRDGSSEVSERIDTTVGAPRACSKYEIRVYDVDAEIMGTRY